MVLSLMVAAVLGMAPTGMSSLPAGPDTIGTLIVAHGGGPEWDARVEAIAREARLPGPVGVSFLMGPGAKTHRFQDVVSRLVAQGAREIVVVPMLVSSHSGHYDQIRYLAGTLDVIDTTMMHHLHMSGITRPTTPVRMRVTAAMDDAPDIASVLVARALSLAESPKEQALMLVGHGPNSAEDYAAWMGNLRRIADTVRARTGFRSVLIELVRDDAPPAVRAEAVTRLRELVMLQHQLTGRTVVVVPVLVSTGRVSTEKLPRDLAGLPIKYTTDGLLPHAGVARWIEARVAQRDALSAAKP